MQKVMTSCLLALSITTTPISALPDLGIRTKLEQNLGRSYESLWPSSRHRFLDFEKRDDSTGINHNPDGTPFLWLPQDTYAGETFFDTWDFFNKDDPTHGQVDYVNQSTAQSMGLFWVADNGTAFMKADDTSVLPLGVNRSRYYPTDRSGQTQLADGHFQNSFSIRITSKKTYNTGLFILDLNRAPWGCAIWPAFWTVGGSWPHNGEIDILEGVHDNQHNQIAWHTDPGCNLDTNTTFTGTIPNNSTDCDANANSNSGCDVVEWSQASYGPFFESQGGGILAMKWDENDISIWSFFRAAIPNDVTAGTPNPSLWGAPSAMLMSTKCNIPKFFANHSIVFDITFCGDWAGNSYATSGCPGTCPERMTDPTNFVNATWSINSLKIYRKQVLGGNSTSAAIPTGLVQSITKAQVLIPIVLALAHDFW